MSDIRPFRFLHMSNVAWINMLFYTGIKIWSLYYYNYMFIYKTPDTFYISNTKNLYLNTILYLKYYKVDLAINIRKTFKIIILF